MSTIFFHYFIHNKGVENENVEHQFLKDHGGNNKKFCETAGASLIIEHRQRKKLLLPCLHQYCVHKL